MRPARRRPDGAGEAQRPRRSRLPRYLANFLPFDPGSKVTVERTYGNMPGFQGWKFKRTGEYPELAAERKV